jgi:hypothetical protein
MLRMSGHARQLMARVLVVVASAGMVLALVAGYVRRAGVDSDQFANRATAALRDDSVRTLVAERITDQVVLRNERGSLSGRDTLNGVRATSK